MGKKATIVFGHVGFKRIHVAEVFRKQSIDSFSKYLSQMQKELRCGPFLQGVASNGIPETGKSSGTANHGKCCVTGKHGSLLGFGCRNGAGELVSKGN